MSDLDLHHEYESAVMAAATVPVRVVGKKCERCGFEWPPLSFVRTRAELEANRRELRHQCPDYDGSWERTGRCLLATEPVESAANTV